MAMYGGEIAEAVRRAGRTAHRRDHGLHLISRLPAGQIEIAPGTAMASADSFELMVTGRGGHGASPHLAVDPIVIAAHVLIGLQQLVTTTVAAGDAAVLTIGELIAGSAPNIIPETAVMRGSLRALRAAEQTARVQRCAGAELGHACVVPGTAVLASDDMSLFLEQRPGCYFRVGAAPIGREPPAHHSPRFEIDEAGLAVGARVAATILLGSLAA